MFLFNSTKNDYTIMFIFTFLVQCCIIKTTKEFRKEVKQMVQLVQNAVMSATRKANPTTELLKNQERWADRRSKKNKY